jgi:NADPH-dependent ferric siderophore reductase
MTFPEPTSWQLEVAAVTAVTPRMRRIQLTSPTLETFSYLPGQDLALGFRREDGSTVRRRYSIRRFARSQRWLEIDVVMHGDGPGMRWAQAAAPGIGIDAIGPRGKISLVADAEWHLFAGDATAVPGALAMMEAVPAGVSARAYLQVDDASERQAANLDGDHRISWHYEPDAATPAAAGLQLALSNEAFPPGRGHAYLAGEVSLVMALKSALMRRGWGTDQISAKAYWNRGRPNADRGEPEERAS